MSVNIEYAELISQDSGSKRGFYDSAASSIRSFAGYFRRSSTANMPALASVAYARVGEWGPGHSGPLSFPTPKSFTKQQPF
jgi:hypothetical protein